MASFTVDYSLERAGWALAMVSNDVRHVKMTTSYLHDSLRELAMCGIALLKGANRAKVVFLDEPGEHHLIFKCEGENTIHYEIRWYDDWASWDMYPLDKYNLIMTGRSTLNRVSGEILKSLRDIFENHGLEEYKKLWVNHDFPVHEFRELEQLKGNKSSLG